MTIGLLGCMLSWVAGASEEGPVGPRRSEYVINLPGFKAPFRGDGQSALIQRLLYISIIREAKNTPDTLFRFYSETVRYADPIWQHLLKLLLPY